MTVLSSDGRVRIVNDILVYGGRLRRVALPATERHQPCAIFMDNKKEIARRTTLALAAIKQAASDADSSVPLFVSHHLEVLDSAYWQQYAGKPRPSQNQILDLLVLRSHWGAEGDDG